MNFGASGDGPVFLKGFLHSVLMKSKSTICTKKRQSNGQSKRQSNRQMANTIWPNSPGSLTDNWKVMDDSSVNFHDAFLFIFCQMIAKNEEKHIMEIYG